MDLCTGFQNKKEKETAKLKGSFLFLWYNKRYWFLKISFVRIEGTDILDTVKKNRFLVLLYYAGGYNKKKSGGEKLGEKIRLDRLLSNMGLGSRREVGALLKSGCVKVDDRVEHRAAYQVDVDEERVFCNGKEIRYQKYTYLVMNKPDGVISSTDDPREKTVIDLLPDPYRGRGLFPAGRLDKDTVGLLILTNNGTFAHNMLSPKKHVEKTYFARIDQEVTGADQAAFLEGVILNDGYKTLPAKLTILRSGKPSEVELTISEGKFHQVKRMFEAVSKQVIYLKRTKIGQYSLPAILQEGEFLEISEKEIENSVFSSPK